MEDNNPDNNLGTEVTTSETKAIIILETSMATTTTTMATAMQAEKMETTKLKEISAILMELVTSVTNWITSNVFVKPMLNIPARPTGNYSG